MRSHNLNIKSLLDIPEWEKIQDQIAKLTGTAIITIDYKGTPVTKHSERTEFCTVIRENPISRKRCFKCDALAGLEAVRNGKPFIYLCHCGIVDVAVPVVVGDRYLGAVMFGQVRIPNHDTDAKVERLVNEISTFEAENETVREDLLDMYNRLPEMEYRKIQDIADMIDSVVHYIVNRTLKEENETLQYEYMLQSGLPPAFDGGQAGDAVISKLSKISSPPRQTDYLNSVTPEENGVSVGSPIYPAVSFIERNRGEMPSMAEMAKLCHLSPNYFSKVFLREAGENYTEYLHRKKTTWAKSRMTGEPEASIGDIALSLGYQDTSYFVKVFKKFEGITPSVYKRNCLK